MSLPFESPGFLFLILAVIPVWKRVRQTSVIGFSSNELLQGLTIRIPLVVIERLFLSVFIMAGALILARPMHIEKTTAPVYQDARDIAIVLDISGSMTGQNIQTARDVIAEFVSARPNDRIALFVFDTEAYMEWPLSPDHESLIYHLDTLTLGGGTTITPGVIAGLNHLRRYGQHPGALIVVSDGSSDLKPSEKTATEQALGQTKLYFVQIGKPDDASRIFWAFVEKLGGKVFNGEIGKLGEIFSEISNLETRPVIWEQRQRIMYQFGALPLVALLGLLGAATLECLRRV